ncbi:MAG: glycogen/starch synthase [Candidatus Zixiibacteriota bacterium]
MGFFNNPWSGYELNVFLKGPEMTSVSSRPKPKKSGRKIVFVTFETEFAPCGGLAAVMRIFPKELARSESCFTIAPYFGKITEPKAIAKQIRKTKLTFNVSFGGKTETVKILKHETDSGFKTYLLDSERFFNAPRDPYINPGNPDQLLRDALFLCAAVPKALVALRETHDLILHLQDWESASVAHTIALEDSIKRSACILTMHNPYDRGLTEHDSALISAQDLPGPTVLTKMIPLLDGPLATVSQNFAEELTSDPLQTDVFADHLQQLFKEKTIVGIDNGLFRELKFPFSEEAEREAESGGFHLIKREKWERRIRLGEKIADYLRKTKNNPEFETWGNDFDLSDPKLPVFFFLGRDDPRQKGYDVACEAIRKIHRNRARYIFTPMPGDEGFDGLNFLRKLIADRPGEVIVFPFRIDFETFIALQQGSSFMVMCSLYEPFGGANEAYLAGMPVVARATGGLVQQTVPISEEHLSPKGQQLVERYHAKNAAPTGFLYREPSSKRAIQGWQTIVDCAYLTQTPIGDRVADRKGTRLFDSMVEAAAGAIAQAIAMYVHDQNAYAEVIYNGYRILGNFSWERAITEYRRMYDDICDP